jgi:hypothetical protein
VAITLWHIWVVRRFKGVELGPESAVIEAAGWHTIKSAVSPSAKAKFSQLGGCESTNHPTVMRRCIDACRTLVR